MNFRGVGHITTKDCLRNLQNELLWLFPAIARISCRGGRERAQTIDSGSKNGVSYQSVHKMRSSGTGASEAPELGLL